jgi:hypothetical protein
MVGGSRGNFPSAKYLEHIGHQVAYGVSRAVSAFAESIEQRAESIEHRAESREQRE